MKAKGGVFAAVLGGLIVSLVVIGSIVGVGQAAPPAAPTPVANLVNSNDALNVSFQSATALTADTNTGGQQLPTYEWLDIQYNITQATSASVNTTTIKIQFSNDNSNWVTGPTIVSASDTPLATTSDITRVPIFGRYVRFNQDVTNSNPVTITLIGLAK